MSVLCGLVLVGASGLGAEQPNVEALDTFNYAVGTQTIGPKYGTAEKTRLIETAEAIREMGSNLIKISVSPRYAKQYGIPEREGVASPVDLVRDEPSYRAVLDMPFAHYLIWVYGFPTIHWRDGLSPVEWHQTYTQMRELSCYLLEHYNDSGKTFLLGHWEGDWSLLGHYDLGRDPEPEAIEGMVSWLNVRQQAVEDARRETPHTNVGLYHYAEVNLLQKAIEGKETVANNVLPRCPVDFVSYSAWDSISMAEGGEAMRKRLHAALDHIESKLAPKNIFGKRVFIGEYGFPLQQVKSPETQARHSVAVARAALEWGCPYVLYWQMYCNEAKEGGADARGFWLIDNKGEKQPLYDDLQRFLGRGRDFVAGYKAEKGRAPAFDAYREKAVEWLAPAGE